jgi:hypothetical protein
MSVKPIDFDMHDVYKKKQQVRDVLNKCHVIQIKTLSGKKICSCVYDNETLHDLYQKCYDTLFNTSNILRVEKYHTVRDEIPNQTYHAIYDIVLLDKDEHMLSIPCDRTIKFYDFKRANERHFVPSSHIPVLSVYKFYVIDNVSLDYQIKKQENKPESVVTKMRRYISCAI